METPMGTSNFINCKIFHFLIYVHANNLHHRVLLYSHYSLIAEKCSLVFTRRSPAEYRIETSLALRKTMCRGVP